MGRRCDIVVRFHEPPEDLRRFFTTFYRAEFTCPDGPVHDALQPEWAGLRFFDRPGMVSSIAGGEPVTGTDFAAMGPSSVPVEFALPTTRMWGLGLLPLGWSTFMSVPASAMANRVFDGRQEPAFARFNPLADTLTADAAREEAELARIVRFFRHETPRKEPEDPRVPAIHAVLVDPALPDVAGMVERTGLNQRTLERVCRRAFGFAPKKLLRRQRFMRSVAQFMLDPSLGWIGAIDALYVDQSHFVRDCHEFLGMTPSEYAAQDHPVLAAFMRERMKAHGSAAQTLDDPA
ncbi:helix-turn-helix domain-containing protein [Leptolyngbya sp. 15MV]|nr:helix-turn-helix domain-containing protein [Leptolyngbya sp. 15MV]